MSKELILNLSGNPVTISIDKVDRSDLYGQIISEMLDNGIKCTRVSVLMDGTVLGPGSTAKALMIDGSWIEEQDTRRWTPEGAELVKQESSFKHPPLGCGMTSLELMLNFCAKSVYTFERLGDIDIYTTFNYTAGYPKPCFLITGADGNGYMLVGEPAPVSWVGHLDTSTGEYEEWEEDDIEALFN